MDTGLHCNDLSCRALCSERAVVTTCSHIFCLSCADRLGLSAPKDGRRKCPACATHLDHLDDAVVTSLNPTEDYKTSILSGFSPAIIMECAGRGLSFWSYQMAQEITYQAYLTRKLQDENSDLTSRLDSTVRDANDDSQKLNHKIDALNADLGHIVETNQRLNDEVRKKTKAVLHFQGLYNKLKEHQLGVDLGGAASRDTDNILQGLATAAPRLPNHRVTGMPPRRSNSNGSGGSGEQNRRMTLGYVPSGNPGYRSQQGSRAGMGSSQGFPNATPSQGNRQHLPTPTYGQFATGVMEGLGPRNGAFQHGTPLVNIYSHPSQTGYRAAANPGNSLGLSSNVKVGRQQQTMPQQRMAGGYSTMHAR